MSAPLSPEQDALLSDAIAQGYDPIEALKLSNQLCFPLYACSKELVRRYKPYLEELGLTYTQYIAMMVLWERGTASVKELGEQLKLDSGTLTPMLKKLEAHGLVSRQRSSIDERQLNVSLTREGDELRNRAALVPLQIGSCVDLEPQEASEFLRMLVKVMAGLERSWETD